MHRSETIVYVSPVGLDCNYESEWRRFVINRAKSLIIFSIVISINIALLAGCSQSTDTPFQTQGENGKSHTGESSGLKQIDETNKEPIDFPLPLSDPGNEGDWVVYEPMTDEFEGEKLDSNKWWSYNPSWIGREPVFFHPKCVEVDDGRLLLKAYKTEKNANILKQMPEGYTHAAGYIQSKGSVKYGYFEIKAKLMSSTLVSGFWFYGGDTEIDVVEVPAGVEMYRNILPTNFHVHRSPDVSPFSDPQKWTAPFNFADAYHIYGFEWDEELIKIYVDGELVRVRENDHFHHSFTMNINNEANEWLGAIPDDVNLPAVYSIEYVRAWKNKLDSQLITEVNNKVFETSFEEGIPSSLSVQGWECQRVGSDNILSLKDKGWYMIHFVDFGLWNNYEWKVRVRATTFGDVGSAINLLFNGGNDRGYRVFVYKDRIQTVQYTLSGDTVIGEKKMPFSENCWYDIKIIFNEGTIEVYVDGEMQITVEDDLYPIGGPFAIASWQTEFDINYVSVRELTEAD